MFTGKFELNQYVVATMVQPVIDNIQTQVVLSNGWKAIPMLLPEACMEIAFNSVRRRIGTYERSFYVMPWGHVLSRNGRIDVKTNEYDFESWFYIVLVTE